MRKMLVFLHDAIGAPDFLRRLNGEGPYKDLPCFIPTSEIRQAEDFCNDPKNKDLTVTLTRMGLHMLRECTLPDVRIIGEVNYYNSEDDITLITNQDGTAALMQQKYNCKTARFSYSLKPYTGFKKLQLSSNQTAKWHTDGYIPTSRNLKSGQFVIFTNDGNSTYGSVGRKQGNKIVPLQNRTVSPFGIKPRSDWQLIMIEMLLSKTQPISVIGARAGAGKTLLAAACALHLRSNNDIRSIVYVPPINKEPPIPGNSEEKMAPYIYGLRDALGVIDAAARSNHIPMTRNNLATQSEELSGILDRYAAILSLINGLNLQNLNETLKLLDGYIELVHSEIAAQDHTSTEQLSSANSLILDELKQLLGALAGAEKSLLSLRQGNMHNFIRAFGKSIKEAQKSINATISPKFRQNAHQPDIVKKYGIEIMSAQQLRSRSLADTFVIVDEAQFFELSDIDALGSRASTNSHITFLGDARQTYNLGSPNVMNGMLILTQSQMTSENGSVLIVPPSVRSERKDSADFIASLEGISTTSIARSML